MSLFDWIQENTISVHPIQSCKLKFADQQRSHILLVLPSFYLITCPFKILLTNLFPFDSLLFSFYFIRCFSTFDWNIFLFCMLIVEVPLFTYRWNLDLQMAWWMTYSLSLVMISRGLLLLR